MTCVNCSKGRHMACLYKGRSLLNCDCDTCNQIYADAQADLMDNNDYDWEIVEYDDLSEGG